MRGPLYPLENDTTGKLVVGETDEALAESWLHQFILATPGSRPMMPGWGAGLAEFAFDAPAQVTQALLASRIRKAEQYMPVSIDNVEFSRTASGKAQVVVSYSLLGDLDSQARATTVTQP